MMTSRLSLLSASILPGSVLAATYAALVLCLPATWAQSIPQGYTATREGDVLVMRPSAAADPDVTIRVYPPVANGDGASVFLRRWAESHRPSGVDPTALRVQSQTLSGMSSLERTWNYAAQVRHELILMPQAGPGRYQPVVARMPSQPELVRKHSEALGHVVALIVQGQFQPNLAADGTGNQTAPRRPAPGPTPRAETQATTEPLARLAAEIETVGFMTRTQMGVGGMFVYIPKPVALFRNGDALLDIGNFNRVTSVEGDRAAHPKDWGRWKRSSGGIELLDGDKWKRLSYTKTMERLPAGFVLSGDYDYLSGGGDTAIGGGNMIVSQRHYSFRPNGKYSSDRLGFVSSREELDSKTVGHTVVRSQSPPVVGRYRVDRYLLRLEPLVGPLETHVFVSIPRIQTLFGSTGMVTHGSTSAGTGRRISNWTIWQKLRQPSGVQGNGFLLPRCARASE